MSGALVSMSAANPRPAAISTKPNFLVIGAPKAATTAVCFHLGQHPEVFMCRPKEPFFFCYDEVYAKGWNWYESLFKGAEKFKAIGEGTTVYSQTGTYPHTIERIQRHVPEARIIYITRDPLKRLESMWMELLSQGLTMLPFNRALREDPQYIDSALYYKQLSAYRSFVPDDRILLLFFEDFRSSPHDVLRSCFRFLGVDPEVRIEGAETPRYTSDSKRRDRRVTNVLRRRIPGFERMRNAAPAWIRAAAMKLLKKPIERRPEWDPDVRAWVLRSIKADIEAYLSHCGRPVDFWKMD